VVVFNKILRKSWVKIIYCWN